MIFSVSLLIVAFGQPAFASFLGALSAAFGYALFLKSLLAFSSLKRRFWAAVFWYTAVQAIQLSWMTSYEYQGIYILFVCAVLSIFLGLQFGFFTLFIKKENSHPRILALASLWTLLEWSRYFFLCGFTWNPAGLSLSGYSASLQMASIFGILGLSFWVMFVNLMALRAFKEKRVRPYVVWGFVALFPYLFGFFHLMYHEKKQKKSTHTLSILLVQTGLMPSQKTTLPGRFHEFIAHHEQWNRILRLIKDKGSFDLVVFPEASVPFSSETFVYTVEKVKHSFTTILGEESSRFFPESGAAFFNEKKTHVSNCFWAQTIASYLNAELMIGLDHTDNSKDETYNSVLHFSPKKTVYDRYDKRILLPLAEYLPFQWLYPLVKIYGVSEFFTHGKTSKIFNTCFPIAASICYEETFPHLIREGRLNGAKLLVNVSNDAWYPYSKLAWQHFDHARVRSVENGVPMVRACNSGITAGVDSLGRIVAILPEYDERGRPLTGVLKAQINTYEYSTLYQLWGNWGILILSLLCIVIFTINKNLFNKENQI